MNELKKAMMAHMARIAEYRKVGTAYDTYAALEEAMFQSDEADLRQFLSERNASEFEQCGYGFLKCALKFRLPFVEFIEGLAEEKGWTEYTRDMIGEARAEVE